MPDLCQSRIDHAARAERTIRAVMNYGDTPAEAASTVDMLAALTHATLALVEQQRISNLIALNRETFASHQALLTLSNARTVEVVEQVGLDPAIAAALGIEVQP